MRILPDGTVEIKNKRTGETKIVKPAELPSFGIPYSKFVDEAKAYEQINQNTTGETGGTITPSILKPKIDQKTKTTVDMAKNIYSYVDKESKGLAFGDSPDINLLSGLPGIGQRINSKAYTWETQRPALAIQIATSVFGAEKRVSEKEREAYLSRLPSIYDTKETRAEKLRKLREQINNDLKSKGASTLKGEKTKSLNEIFGF